MNKNRTTIFPIIAIAFLIYPLSVWGQTFSLSLDADNALGDQSVLSVDVPAGNIVPIQIIGHGLRGTSVLRFRLEYDRHNLTYDDLARSYITYYDGWITYTAGHDYLEVECSFADPVEIDSGIIFTIGFILNSKLSSTQVSLLWAETDQKNRVSLNSSVRLNIIPAISSDFNNDGLVDFSDFLIFVSHFGSNHLQSDYDYVFDLNNDGFINFSDFLIFVDAFSNKSKETSNSFDIELVFVDDSLTSHEKDIIARASERWESIIKGDLSPVDHTIYPLDVWDSLLEERIYVNDVVDDVRIFVASKDIAHAGRGGPRVLRDDNGLPITGAIIIDKETTQDNQALLLVALHEIGHVLGIGTLWDNFIVNPSVNNENADTHFKGPLAIEAFDAAGGTSYTAGEKVPVENGGDDSHWRENVFIDELMDPIFTTGSSEALSAITIQALADLGYSVDVTQADAYRLPTQPTKRPVSSKHEYCIPIRPRYIVDEHGRIVRIINDAN